MDAILERLATDGGLSVAALSEQLGVSSATIRRDLERLHKQRLLIRTHGGASAKDVLYELPYRYRDEQQRDQKRQIATVAAARVADGSVVGLTAGTTTTWIARALVDHHRITVVTNALNIASELSVRPNIKVVATGGVARGEQHELTGPLAVASLRALHMEIVFVGAGGISAQAGLSTQDELAADINAAMIGQAKEAIAVLDGSKVGRRSFATICEIADLAELITTADADGSEMERLETAGLKVTVV